MAAAQVTRRAQRKTSMDKALARPRVAARWASKLRMLLRKLPPPSASGGQGTRGLAGPDLAAEHLVIGLAGAQDGYPVYLPYPDQAYDRGILPAAAGSSYYFLSSGPVGAPGGDSWGDPAWRFLEPVNRIVRELCVGQ